MLKKLVLYWRSRRAARRKVAAGCVTQAVHRTVLGLEALESRLTPAPAPVWQAPPIVAWKGPGMDGTNDWSDKANWVGNSVATGKVDAYFNQTAANPFLTGSVGIKLLTVRGGGNGDKLPAAAYDTELDLKGNSLNVSAGINVLSAAGNAPAIGDGPAPGSILSLNTSQGSPTVRSGSITVGEEGKTVMKAGQPTDAQNSAKLSIGKNVTVDAGIFSVFVGGNTLGALEVDGILNARNLSVGGVGSPGGATTGATLDGQVNLSGSLTVGAQNNFTGKANRFDDNGKAYVPTNLVNITTGNVKAGTGLKATDTAVQIGDYTQAELDIASAGSLDAKGAMNVGSPKNASGKGTLNVSGKGTLTVAGTFTNTTNGATTLKTGSNIEFKVQPTNKGKLTVEKGVNFKARGIGGLLNQGNIQFGAAPGAANGDIAMQGDFTQQADGHLAIQIAGNQVGVSYDRLLVSALDDGTGGGNVALDGTLDMSSTYAPKPWLIGGPAGDYFTVVSASQSLTGHFNPLTGLNLPDPSQFASTLPALPSGYGYQWHVIYDTTDSFDSNLAASDPAISSQPWAGNGTRDAILVLEEAPLKPDLVITSATPSGTNSVTVGYIVENQAVTQAFNVSLFTSQDGHTPDTPNTPFATVAVASAALGVQTTTISFPGQALPAGEQLIAEVDSGNTVAESSESDNALVLGQFQASDGTEPAAAQIFPYTLTLAAPSDVPVTVNYQTADGTAVAGTDYTAVSGSVTFAPGQTQQEIDVPLLGGSPGKTFLLHFSSPADGYFVDASGQVVAQADAHLTIAATAPSGVVSGYAWQDDNTNGMWDQNESGLANVLVNLTEPDGTVLSTQADATGYYEFDNLPLGTYALSAAAPPGTIAEGYYQDDGTPVPSASVTLTGTQPTADLDAAFMAGKSTSTSLTSSSPSVYAGQSVTFTASVSSTVTGTPTGPVLFYNGTTLLGTSALTAGSMGSQASLSTSALSVGNHDITAVYEGDSTYASSTSSVLTETIQQPTSYTSLSVNSSTSVPGHAVTFTASVSGMGSSAVPTGPVMFWDGNTLLGSGTLTAGGMGAQATFTTSALPLGGHNVIAVFGGDATYAGSTSAPLIETIHLASTYTSLSESVSFSTPGQAVLFTATVSSMMGTTPTGLVKFFDNGTTLLGTGTLSQGPMGAQATFTDAALALGGHSITAVYQGDSANAGSTSSAQTETVQKLTPFVSLSASTQNANTGQAITFTATVNSMSGGTPTGTVNFMDGTTLLGIGTLVMGGMGNQATFTTSTLPVGNHNITAVYSADAAFVSATSSALTETVQQASTPTTSTSLSTSSQNTFAGQAVTFTATVTRSGMGAMPTGSVTFSDGNVSLGVVALSSYMGMGGQAVFTISNLSVGNHTIKAVYGGDSTYTGSTSNTIAETVQRTSVMEMESTSNSYALFGQAVTFTATIYSMGGVAPTGTVSFWDGSTLLGTINLSQVGTNYQAAFTISTLSRGSHTIVALYSGDVDYNSASASVGETIS